ncbi:MAG: glycoside hydrolase family 3 [Bacteroidetes bacterium]|nr:glycoside hydrolase family 3 [Bacteroidota bacterium]
MLLVPVFLAGFLFSGLTGNLRGNSADSLDVKIGQMLMVGFRGTTARMESPIAKDIQDLHLGGVILFDFDVAKKEYGRNIQSPMQLLDLTDQLQHLSPTTLLIGVDQEGGVVCRLKTSEGFPQHVSHAYLGSTDITDTTRYYSDLMARSLAIVGININFAPVVDLNVNPLNPVIGELKRSFSSDPETVTRHAALMIEAMHARGVISAIKHFPGHGSSMEDSHLGFVDVTDTWSEKELQPYRTLIAQGLPDVIMTGHIFNRDLDPDWPATLSAKIIRDLLRGELGFGGVVISDDMMMRAITDRYGMETAIRQAVNAGVDILIFGNNTYAYDPTIARKAFTTLKNLVLNGEIPMARIDEANEHIRTLKARIQQLERSP